MPDDLHHLTIAAASEALRTRRISPVELTEAFLARIAALDSRLNSYILVLGDTARAEARAAEAEIAAGRWRGPLHGIPLALKDIYNTAGIATTGHSALFRDHVPTADATTVRKLREAGAVMLGKASTWEFAIGGSSFDLPWPPARNPWDVARDTSGSSSGSGAAVAAGLAMGAMGSDTGGSIRGPAAWCGIAGHKPTYGLVSRSGVLPLSFAMDHAGPMCWTAQDCALMLDVLAGYDPADPASADVTAGPFATGMGGRLDGVRVGVVRHFFEADLSIDADTASATASTLAALAEMGAVLSEVTLPPFDDFASVGTVISRSEAYAIHADHPEADAGTIRRDGQGAADGGRVLHRRRLYRRATAPRAAGRRRGRGAAGCGRAGVPDRPPPGHGTRREHHGRRDPTLPEPPVQRHREPGCLRLQRLHRRRPADRLPDRRAARSRTRWCSGWATPSNGRWARAGGGRSFRNDHDPVNHTQRHPCHGVRCCSARQAPWHSPPLCARHRRRRYASRRSRTWSCSIPW